VKKIIMVLLFVFGVSSAIPLFGQETPSPISTASPLKNTFIHQKGYEGVIFACDSPAVAKDSCWVPTDKEIRKMEKGLENAINIGHQNFSFLIPKKGQTPTPNTTPLVLPLVQYKRQYFGIYENGRKVIFVNLFCGEKSYWKQNKVTVADGGSCYIQIKYDVLTGKYFDYMENGLA
jgi:hypothetical protein